MLRNTLKCLFRIILKNKYNLSQTNPNIDTIFALSSGLNTAISIVRISGPQSQKVLSLVSQQKAKKILSNPRYMEFSRLYTSTKQLIDQGMIVYFPQNQSYNKEKIFQLHLHGSRAVVQLVFQQLKKLNMRIAQRGQFTKRAVINGKLSLNQAQAINDLIESQTQFKRQISINNLIGKNVTYIEQLKQDLVAALAKCQAYIDFNQDQVLLQLNLGKIYEQIDKKDVKQTLFDDTKQWVRIKTIPKLNNLLRNYKNLKILKQGVNTIILGRPNVGKSTLINLLSNRPISIVTNLPGTTRDLIQTSIQISGFRLNLIDTAGLRQTTCLIQEEGVRKAKERSKESHLRILMVDWAQEHKQYHHQNKIIMLNVDTKDDQVYQVFRDQKTIVVLNKIDLIQPEYKDWQIILRSNDKDIKSQDCVRQPSLSISAIEQTIPSILLTKLSTTLHLQFSQFLNPNQIFFTRERYFIHLQKCLQKLELYVQEEQVDFASQYLREAIQQIKEIFGRVDSEHVLDVLFRDFCIGK